VTQSHSTQSQATYIVITDVLCVRRHDATVEATFSVLFHVLVRYTWIAKFSTNDRMITRPELERDNITRKGVDAVGRKVVCFVADFDRVYSDLALLYRERSVVDGSCRAVDVLTRCEARQSSE